MLILAHRGASKRALENSMDAFRKALGSGCDGIEFDVHFCNGQALIIHDDNLYRTHGVDVALSELDESLRQQQQIPTLMQIMALLPQDMTINIEVKSADDIAFMQAYMTRVKALGLLGKHVVISSFNYRLLVALQTLSLDVRWGVLTDSADTEFFNQLSTGNFQISGFAKNLINSDIMQQATIQQTDVWVFTTDEPSEWEHLQGLGVAGIFTNTPHEAVQWQTKR